MPRKNTVSKKESTVKNKLLKIKSSLKNNGNMIKNKTLKTSSVFIGIAGIVGIVLILKKLIQDKMINNKEKVNLKLIIAKLEEVNKKLKANLDISKNDIKILNEELQKARKSLKKMKDIEEEIKKVQKLFKDMNKKID